MNLIKKFFEYTQEYGFRFAIGTVILYPFLIIKKMSEKKVFEKYKKIGSDIDLKIMNNKMLLNTKGEGIHKDLIIHKIREPDCVKIIKNIVDKNDVIYDIGANIGYYSLIFSKKAKKIYAIEPYEENLKYLKKNIKLNNKNNIHIKKIAFSSKKGKKPFYISEKCNWCSMNKNVPYLKKKIKIDVDTLDNFSKKNKYPTFLRMDLEGHEYEVLYEGGKGTIKKYKPKIFLELHPTVMSKNKTLRLLKFLKNQNYDINHILCDEKDFLLGNSFISKIIKKINDWRINLKIKNIDELIHSIEKKRGFFTYEIFLSAKN